MAELHISGQISDATGFAGASLFCEARSGVITNRMHERCGTHDFDCGIPCSCTATFLIQLRKRLSLLQWGIATGTSWEVLQGFEHGRTQVVQRLRDTC